MQHSTLVRVVKRTAHFKTDDQSLAWRQQAIAIDHVLQGPTSWAFLNCKNSLNVIDCDAAKTRQTNNMWMRYFRN